MTKVDFSNCPLSLFLFIVMALCCFLIQTRRFRKLHNSFPLHLSRTLMSSAPPGQLTASEGVIKRKLNELVQWYEETTGMDEVRVAQKRVLEAEEKFIVAQERRREANKEMVIVQNKLKDLYAELDNTPRGEERYVALITEEHKLLKIEKKITSEFQQFEREEREQFSALSSAVKESHEKERAQAERTKYWSIIGSIIGTVIGIVGSSVNNELKMKELRKLIKETTAVQKRKDDISIAIPEALTRHEEQLSFIVNELKNASNTHNNHTVGNINELVQKLENKVKSEKTEVNDTLNVLRKQQVLLEKNLKEIKTILATQSPNKLPQITDVESTVHFVEDSTESNNDARTLLLFSSAVIIFPFIFKYFGFTFGTG